MNSSKLISFTLSTLLCIPFVTQSNPIKSDYLNIEGLSIAGSIGYLSGKSKEYVYDPVTGHKISELDWNINGLAIIRGEFNYRVLQWLDFNAQGWINLGQGSAVMDDYDWLNPNQILWTHWSHHDDTNVRQGNEFDLNFRAWTIQNPSYQLAAMAGYQRTLFSFRAHGGCFTYNNGADTGCFIPGASVIGYKQVFESPYIGLAGRFILNAFEFKGLFKYSNWVNANDVDQHYLRNLTFKDGGDQSQYYNVVLNAGYFVKPFIKLFVEGSLGYFSKNKAATSIFDHNTGSIAYLPNGSAGLENRNYIIALGVQYNGHGIGTK
jgi:outer membrane protease